MPRLTSWRTLASPGQAVQSAPGPWTPCVTMFSFSLERGRQLFEKFVYLAFDLEFLLVD